MRVAAIVAIALLTVACAHGVSAPSSPQPAVTTTLDHAQRIENWRHDHRAAFTTLGTAMAELGDAMVANDWTAVHTDCAKLTDATRAMHDALPSPDERLNAAFEGALQNLDAAMTECPSLNADSDRIDANTFVTNIEHAMDQLNVIKEILK